MSRIGSQPIKIPDTVMIEIEQNKVRVKGPKGELEVNIPLKIAIKKENDRLRVLRKGEAGKIKALHGLVRSLISNAVLGVIDGFKRTLEIKGVGYRAKLEGEKLVLNVGFSHPVTVQKPEGLEFRVEGPKITVSGIDKQLVGQTAANIRKIKPPDPYKGKGIRHEGEVVKLKPGKAAKAGGEGK